jgi:SAM-dependent methyltransferase
MTETLQTDQISREVLLRSQKIRAKDGSQGLDALVSLHQYHLAYRTTFRLIPTGATVLDWGGGSGHFSYFLHRLGCITRIFSFSHPSFVESEIEKGLIDCIIADPNEPTRLPYPDKYFDAVFSIGVLEHVRETGGNEKDSLLEIHRILKPGGFFICYHFPRSASWIEWLAAKLGFNHHQFTYSQAEIKNIFDNVMPIVELKRYALLPRNMFRHLPKLIANHSFFCMIFDALDRQASRFLPWITQNWMVIARKRGENE